MRGRVADPPLPPQHGALLSAECKIPEQRLLLRQLTS